jgi:hypothetical protein
MLARRIRAVLISMALWAVPWTLVSLAIALAARLGVFGSLNLAVASPAGITSLFVIALILGLITGLTNGLIFALVLLIAERGHGIAKLRPWRFAIWGAIASAAPGAMFTQSILVAAIFAVIGALGGLLALALAKAGSGEATETTAA